MSEFDLGSHKVELKRWRSQAWGDHPATELVKLDVRFHESSMVALDLTGDEAIELGKELVLLGVNAKQIEEAIKLAREAAYGKAI